jgi:hypothetical protein
MSIKIAGSNPAEVLLGVEETDGSVMYSTDGNTWNNTKGSVGEYPTIDEIINAVAEYEEQLSQI